MTGLPSRLAFVNRAATRPKNIGIYSSSAGTVHLRLGEVGEVGRRSGRVGDNSVDGNEPATG
jgi:hypothetical protein